MGNYTTTFVPFDEGAYGERYKFDIPNRTIYDTKFSRNIVAGCKRGGRPYYRLVRPDGEAEHVRAEDIFGEEANEDITFDTDFDPSNFADRYRFDFEEGSILRLPGKGPNSGKPMTLLSPNGWKHFLLTRNDGVRVRVTPSEIIKFAVGRDDWEVRPPRGAKVFPQFPDHAFLRDGTVVLIRSKEPLLRPEPCPVDGVPTAGSRDQDSGIIYRLWSTLNREHLISRASIKDLFKRRKS